MSGSTPSWFEVWADETLDVPYLLLLRPSLAGFEILDPAEGGRCVHTASEYEAAKLWLLEDEYVLLARKQRDEG